MDSLDQIQEEDEEFDRHVVVPPRVPHVVVSPLVSHVVLP